MALINPTPSVEMVCAELNQLRRNLSELVAEWEQQARTPEQRVPIAACAATLRWKLELTTTYPMDPAHPDYRYHWRRP